MARPARGTRGVGRAPSHARRRALEILHAADVSASDPRESLAGEDDAVLAIVEGVAGAREEIDDVIRSTAERWRIERMPVVDRNLLRIGVYELTRTDAVARKVIADAVALAKLLSTEDSGRFVNGILTAIARRAR